MIRSAPSDATNSAFVIFTSIGVTVPIVSAAITRPSLPAIASSFCSLLYAASSRALQSINRFVILTSPTVLCITLFYHIFYGIGTIVFHSFTHLEFCNFIEKSSAKCQGLYLQSDLSCINRIGKILTNRIGN